MTANVRDNALLLEVIAGPDGLDTRQRGVAAGRYTEALEGGVGGMRIAVIKEGLRSSPIRNPTSMRRCAMPRSALPN